MLFSAPNFQPLSPGHGRLQSGPSQTIPVANDGGNPAATGVFHGPLSLSSSPQVGSPSGPASPLRYGGWSSGALNRDPTLNHVMGLRTTTMVSSYETPSPSLGNLGSSLEGEPIDRLPSGFSPSAAPFVPTASRDPPPSLPSGITGLPNSPAGALASRSGDTIAAAFNAVGPESEGTASLPASLASSWDSAGLAPVGVPSSWDANGDETVNAPLGPHRSRFGFALCAE